MRQAITMIVVVALCSASRAEDFTPVKEDGVWSLGFKIGSVGFFRDAERDLDGKLLFAVDSVQNKSEATVEAFMSNRKTSALHYRFVVRGLDTSEWVDDKIISLSGMYKVTGTTKVGGSTLYVIEQAKK